ncbi:hypothetical protein VNO78_15509 [Psophocarpus tetragonolobus]|uniref:Uncharacterized protein n=1 Tax=Psophocarpus tetragonolobus TaxID=3891 RepID=A0AAN9SE47_PSOTE
MQSERQQHQSWRVHVTAKANNFRLRLRFAAATNRYKPTSFFRLSILLKLPKFALTINSHPTHQTHGPGFLTNRLIKIRPRWFKKKESNVPCLKDPISVGFWVMGFVPCLRQSISKHAQRGISMLAPVGSLLLLFGKLKIARLVNLVTFFSVLVGAIFYYQFFNFHHNFNYWPYVGRTWNKMVSLW